VGGVPHPSSLSEKSNYLLYVADIIRYPALHLVAMNTFPTGC
jgi:hypothetical protein